MCPSVCSQDECAEMMEDPSADYHLYWEKPPSRMFVVKKIGDPQVTKKWRDSDGGRVTVRGGRVTVRGGRVTVRGGRGTVAD